MNEDPIIPPDAAAAAAIPLATPVTPAAPSTSPVVLGYRNPRDEAARRRRVRERRRDRRRHRRPSKAGIAGLVASAILALMTLATLASAATQQAGPRGHGPALPICTAFPLTYAAVMCGVIGVIPRGKSTSHGWCALALTAASWGAYVAAYLVAAR